MYEVFVRQRLKMCAREARKTGFVPMGDEIVDFDLDEPELTLSDARCVARRLLKAIRVGVVARLSVGSSVFKSTMQKAKRAYSKSKTFQDMRKGVREQEESTRPKAHRKLREKSSEDLASKWAE